MLRSSLLAALGLFTGPLLAQTQYGSPTLGSGGIGPVLSCPQPWLGRANFAITLDQGLGGALGAIVCSQFPSYSTTYGLDLLVDPAHVLSTWFTMLSGTPAVAGAGSGSQPLSLAALPPSPGLAGLPFFYQGFVFDPNGPGLGGGISASNGLRMELTMPPQIFVAAGGGSYWLLDAVGGTAPVAGTQADLNVVNGVRYSASGLDLFVTTGHGDVLHADLRGSAPNWTVTTGTLGTSVVAWGGLAYLEDVRLGWVGGRGNGTEMELLLVNLDPSTPLFGSVMLQTQGLQTALAPFGTFALSPDGRRIAAASPWNGSIAIVDADLSSPSFLQILTVSPIPPSVANPGFTVNTFIAWAPDSGRFWLARQNQGPNSPGEIACYDLATGWVDHDPSTPWFVDHIGATSSPAVTLPGGLRTVAVSRAGDAIFTSGSLSGNGFAARIELATLQSTVASGPTWLTDEDQLALDRDRGRVAVTGNGYVVVYDAETMLELQAHPIATGATEKDLAWR